MFANMLNEMRLGKVSQDTIKAFVEMKRAINYEDDLTATELCVYISAVSSLFIANCC